MATRIQKICGASTRRRPSGAVGVLHVDQVAVVEILDADEVELEIGVGIDRVGEFVEIELGEARIEPLDLDAERDVLQERLAVRFLELVDAVGDFPRQRLLVDIGEENAAGEEAAVGVDIEEVLRVEDDGLALFLRA